MYNRVFKRKQKHKQKKEVVFYFKNHENNMKDTFFIDINKINEKELFKIYEETKDLYSYIMIDIDTYLFFTLDLTNKKIKNCWCLDNGISGYESNMEYIADYFFNIEMRSKLKNF